MKAVPERFLWFWLPGLLIFIVGLKQCWFTGQADPWLWGWAACLILAPTGWWLGRRGWALPIWACMGAAGSALIFCIIAAGRQPDPVAAGGLICVALLGAMAGCALRARRWRIGAAALVAASLLLYLGPAQPIAPVQDRPKLAVITGLPLFWAEPGQGAEHGPADAPIITVLRTRFTVKPMDDLAQLEKTGAKLLLLAQPRSLSPAGLIVIDRWVRDGGTVLVLSDPLLRWPSALPLGDRRRAPSASLLAPLLTHWGFRADYVRDGEVRYVTPDQDLVTVSGIQVFQTDIDDGRVESGDGFVRRKRIGRGMVVVVGDADLLDDRLWLADPARPLDLHSWSADTPARVANWLGAPIPGERRWMRDGISTILAVRWALLAGLIWAILGSVIFTWRAGTNESRTKAENEMPDPRKCD
ncbi:DUF4350 domain-containing protein [Sphingobium sp.]|uniref:DUF4350 domain-containing protein n=1 Tax=Sphingobium sp. TaxID=1912891 RepID=UPI003BB76D8A